tara:strand:- start:29 stop:367 length:339 start_codon:yes stop_codon:yes gene_type:complete
MLLIPSYTTPHFNILKDYNRLKNGSNVTTAANGISNMVALSSMYRNLGVSASTAIGATIRHTIIGVPKAYQQASQMPIKKTQAAIMTLREFMPFLRNSPMKGSPKVREKIRG